MSEIDFWTLPAADRLARLRADRASHEVALEELQPFLERANERLAAAQLDYDAAGAAVGENQATRGGASHGTYETWSPAQAAARRAAAEAEGPEVGGAFQLAQERLEAALSTRTTLDIRRSSHSQQIRLADTLIASTEAELAREQAATEHQADALARIRDRLAASGR